MSVSPKPRCTLSYIRPPPGSCPRRGVRAECSNDVEWRGTSLSRVGDMHTGPLMDACRLGSKLPVSAGRWSKLPGCNPARPPHVSGHNAKSFEHLRALFPAYSSELGTRDKSSPSRPSRDTPSRSRGSAAAATGAAAATCMLSIIQSIPAGHCLLGTDYCKSSISALSCCSSPNMGLSCPSIHHQVVWFGDKQIDALQLLGVCPWRDSRGCCA